MEGDLDIKSWLRVVHAHRRAMQARDSGDQGQAEATARCRAAALQAIEPVEDTLAFTFRNAGAVVGDPEHRLGLGPARAHHDLGPAASMAQGVLDQVDHHLGQ